MTMQTTRLLQVARVCVAVTLLAHLLALFISNVDAAASPISQLSRGSTGWLHTMGLAALGLGWLIIGCLYWRRDHGWLWRGGCLLLLASVPVLLFVASYFATASDARLIGPNANDPLAVLASVLGVAMGALQLGLRRQNPGVARVNLLILALWIALVPVVPFIGADWLGAYERTVGALMLLWTLALTKL
ncbi:MAG: hypothetical protein AAFY29_12825 [Pseudomonadota bacterium]